MSLEMKIKESLIRHEGDVQARPGAWLEVERRVARRYKQRLVAGAAAAALVVTGAALALPRLGTDKMPAPILSEVPQPVSTGAPKLQKKIPVPAFALASGPDFDRVMPAAVWGLVAADGPKRNGRLVRIDPTKNQDVASTFAGPEPVALAVDQHSVWVLNHDCKPPGCDLFETSPIPRNSVARFDSRTLKLVSTINLDHPIAIDASYGAVWVIDQGEAPDSGTRLVRIDPATNEATTAARLNGVDGPAQIIHGESDLYVVHQLANGRYEVLSISADARVIRVLATVEAQGLAPRIAIGAGGLWVTVPGEQSASALMRLNPATGEVLDRVELPDAAPVGLSSITTSSWHVWAGSARGYLWKVKVDRQTNRLVGIVGSPTLVGDAPPIGISSVLAAYNSIWLSVDDGKIWRFAP